MLHLKALHLGLLGNNGLQQEAKGGNVPLSIAERVEQAATGIFGIDFDRLAASKRNMSSRTRNGSGIVLTIERSVLDIGAAAIKRTLQRPLRSVVNQRITLDLRYL